MLSFAGEDGLSSGCCITSAPRTASSGADLCELDVSGRETCGRGRASSDMEVGDEVTTGLDCAESSCSPLAKKNVAAFLGAGAGCSCERTSLAWKNIGDSSIFAVRACPCPCEKAAASRGAALIPGPSPPLTMLSGLLLARDDVPLALSLPLIPGRWSLDTNGLGAVGPVGVPLGVEFALPAPTRDFLDDDRGVMLLLRYGFMGVEKSAFPGDLLGDTASLLSARRADEPADGRATAAVARRGVIGDFTVRVLASAGTNGRP